MGSECNPRKRYYDITMSKRTRKTTLNLEEDANEIPIPETKGVGKGKEGCPRPAGVVDGGEENNDHKSLKQLIDGGVGKGEEGCPRPAGVVDGGEENNDHKSLKQLIDGGGAQVKVKVKVKANKAGRNSLGQRFTEEKQLQLAIRQQEEEGGGTVGVNKSKGTVSRYIKVLSHLIKLKRDPRLGTRKKPLLRLTM